MIKAFAKVLSANDVGSTGGHQCGLFVPRKPQILSFFPTLCESEHNPRVHIQFRDDGGEVWTFAYIYYNNHLIGGTRNEYRLTRMTKYIRQTSLEAGDEIVFSRPTADRYLVSYRRAERKPFAHTKILPAIVWLAPSWKAVEIKEGKSNGGHNE